MVPLSEARLEKYVQVGDSEARGTLPTFISKVLFNGLAQSSLPGVMTVITICWFSELLTRCDWKSAKVIRPEHDIHRSNQHGKKVIRNK